MISVRILYLEDSPDDVALARYMLAHHEQACEWTVAGDGAAFQAALEQGGYDLILLDSQVPGVESQEALQASLAAWPAALIVLITGGSLAARTAMANLRAGAADQIDKQELWRLVPIIQRARERREQAERYQGLEQQARELAAQLAAAKQALAGGTTASQPPAGG